MTSVPPSDNSTGNTAKRDRQPSALFVIVAVALLCVSAIQVAWLAWKHDPRVHVPARVAFILAFVMLAAAAMVALKLLGRGEHMDWLAVPMLLGMTVTFGWIGLYGDPRHCSASGPLWVPLPSCHTAFKGAALILVLMAALAARGCWRSWRFVASRKPPRAG